MTRRIGKAATAIGALLLVVMAVSGGRGSAQEIAQPGSLGEATDGEEVQMLKLEPSLTHPEYADLAAGFTPRVLVYIIQDAEGAVRGRMTLTMSAMVVDGEIRRELTKEYDFPYVGRLQLMAKAPELSPLECNLELFDLDAGPVPQDASPGETWSAKYYYDLVSVAIEAKDVGTFFSFRHPMKAYDLEELYLLFSQLQVERFPRQSVLYVTAPFRHRNYAVLLERRGRESIYAADAEKHVCEHLYLTFSDSVQEFFVETLPPHRVVKYTLGDLTYTLLEDNTEYEDVSRGPRLGREAQ
jgi:hypothetical protein